MTIGEFKRIALCRLIDYVLAALVLFPISSLAQSTPPQYVHEVWTVEDGLPVNSVNDLVQTDDGYIWLATYDGLVRFDGVRFTVFNTSNTEALPSNRITDLHTAPDGSLWLITEQGHLVRFKDAHFTPYATDDGLAGKTALGFYEDPEGGLWVFTYHGVSLIEQRGLVPVMLDLPGAIIKSLLRDRTGALWIGTSGEGLVHYQDGTLTRFTTSDGLDGNSVYILAELPDGTILTNGPTSFRDGASIPVAVEAISFERYLDEFYTHPPSDTQLVSRSLLRDINSIIHSLGDSRTLLIAGIVPEHATQLLTPGETDPHWFASGNRLYRNGQLVHDAGSQITAIMHDHEGSLWFGTATRGLHRLVPSLFTIYSDAEGMVHKNVYPVLEDRTGAMWFGTLSGGLSRLADGVFTSGFEGLPGIFIRSLYEDRQGSLWVSANYGGVCRFRADDRLQCMPFEIGIEAPLTMMHAMFQDRSGAYWFGGEYGLIRFHHDTGTLFTDEGGLENNRVRVFLETEDGSLWMGTNGSGMLIYREGAFTGLTVANGLTSNFIRSLYKDKDGIIWIGTEGNGLNRLVLSDTDGLTPGIEHTLSKASIITIEKGDGLFDESIHQILEDDEGRLWMNTNRGIFWVWRSELNAFAAGEVDRIHSTGYTERDGLRNREGNGGMQPAGIKASDGRLWFPTQDGVAVIDPKNIRRNEIPPPVIIEQVVAQNETVTPREGVISLSAHERDFEIQYTALSYMAPENMRFRYRLEGLQKEWEDVGNRRTAYFTNVPPGQYMFRIMASNNEEVWNEESAALAISVASFFYETWWFYGLVMLGVTILGFVGYQRRVRYLKVREQELKRQVAEQTKDLVGEKEATEQAREEEHRQREEAERLRLLAEEALATVQHQAEQLKELDAAKSRFFANVSHEFRTPLTLTIGPLEDVRAGLYGSVDPDINKQLEMVLRNSRRLLRLVNQLLDIARLEANRMQLRTHEADLTAFLRNLSLAFTAAAERRQIDFEVTLPEDPVPVYFDPDQLEKVFGNLLSNAFKFTPEGGAVRLKMSDHSDDGTADTLRVEVKDTGPGIPADELPHIFERFYQVDETQTHLQAGSGIGLSLAKELVELHGGMLEVQSEEKFGSMFTVTLRLGCEHLAAEQIEGKDSEFGVPGSEFFAFNEREDPLDTATQETPNPKPQTPNHNQDRTTIMVVDDNADLRTYIGNHLQTDYQVIEAENGMEALEQARRQLPDLIISDVMMPELDGYGLCRELKSDRAIDFIPVILLTAKAATDDKVEGFEGGADAYVTKPFEMAELSARVENLIASRQQLRERFSQKKTLHASPVEITSSDDAFLERVKQVVEANLADEDFNVEKMAAEVGQSRSQLHRRLQALLELSPSEVIRAFRLERAAQLLEQKAGLVSEIAYAVGFKSVSHFTRSFQSKHGVAPSAYTGEAASSQ